MDTNRMKRAAEWFYSNVFQDEAIRPRPREPEEKLPSLLRAARSLESDRSGFWQSRESIFYKQAKLLAHYEDEYAFSDQVVRYFPTYQSLSDRELRGYFSWRTGLRRGQLRKTSLSFAFLYIYELLNQIGVDTPEDGYQKLQDFASQYGALDPAVLPYLKNWMTDYVIYYDLPSSLLAHSPQVIFDRGIEVLSNLPDSGPERIMEAVKALAPRWLGRSKFYGQNQTDMDEVIPAVLGRVFRHYETHCQKSMVEQFFGRRTVYPAEMFRSAVFFRRAEKDRVYALDPLCVYRCRGGYWTVERYYYSPRSGSELNDLLKTIDSFMRRAYGYPHPVQAETDKKWLNKVIEEEIQGQLARKKAAEAKKLRLDFSSLDKIRRDAAITQEKLTVEEEPAFQPPVPPPAPAPAPEAPGGEVLSSSEYRLLQCLLYGRDTGWVSGEGLILSVLADSINEKLYEDFQDTVLSLDTPPSVLPDYIDDLKERIHP